MDFDKYENKIEEKIENELEKILKKDNLDPDEIRLLLDIFSTNRIKKINSML